MTIDRITRIATTRGIKAMNAVARKYDLNRQLTTTGLLDPDGIHVLVFSMDHNDDHVRTEWLVKYVGRDAPVRVWIDTSFEAFHRYTAIVNVDEVLAGADR